MDVGWPTCVPFLAETRSVIIGPLFAQVEPARFGQTMNVICFAGCYAAALACELVRFRHRSSARRRISLGLTGLGLVAHTMYLVLRGLYADHRAPLTTLYESLVVLAWMLAVVYVYLAWRDHRSALGVFALPVVLALCVTAGLLPHRGPRTDPPWSPFWGQMHGVLLVAGACAVAMAAVAGLMFLVQSVRLKAKKTYTPGLFLPSLERLDGLNARAVALAFPLLTLGLGLGLVLMVAGRMQAGVWLDWFDPKVVSTAVTWLALGAVVAFRQSSALHGRRMAYATLVVFAMLLFSLIGTDLLLGTGHTPAGDGP